MKSARYRFWSAGRPSTATAPASGGSTCTGAPPTPGRSRRPVRAASWQPQGMQVAVHPGVGGRTTAGPIGDDLLDPLGGVEEPRPGRRPHPRSHIRRHHRRPTRLTARDVRQPGGRRSRFPPRGPASSAPPDEGWDRGGHRATMRVRGSGVTLRPAGRRVGVRHRCGWRRRRDRWGGVDGDRIRLTHGGELGDQARVTPAEVEADDFGCGR
jgi:hypothetical protein